jgi:hypothetical protein
VVRDVGLGRCVFRRAIARRVGARPQGCGVPGWVGPGRKGWFYQVRHPSYAPFCIIPAQPAPESNSVLLKGTPVVWLAAFPRFRLPDLSIDSILTYDIHIDIIAVCLRHLRS